MESIRRIEMRAFERLQKFAKIFNKSTTITTPTELPVQPKAAPSLEIESLDNILPLIEEKYMKENLFLTRFMDRNWKIYKHTKEGTITPEYISEYFEIPQREINAICKKIDLFIIENFSNMIEFPNQTPEEALAL